MIRRMQLRWIRSAALQLGWLVVSACFAPSAHAESLTLLPAKFTLDGPAAEQRLVLELAAPQPK